MQAITKISRHGAIRIRSNRFMTNTIRSKSTTSPPQSSSSSFLQGDAGNIATHIHHKMTTFLSIATPLYFLTPTYTDSSTTSTTTTSTTTSTLNKAFGTLLAINISAHSWIGLNYVVTDYIPKISKALTGPARVVTMGIAGVTLVGLGKVAVNDHGGIKGAVVGLWMEKHEKGDENKD